MTRSSKNTNTNTNETSTNETSTNETSTNETSTNETSTNVLGTVKWSDGSVEVTEPVGISALSELGSKEKQLASAFILEQIEVELWALFEADVVSFKATGKPPKGLSSAVGTRIAGHIRPIMAHIQMNPGSILKLWEGREVKRRTEPSLSGVMGLIPHAGTPRPGESLSDRAVRYLALAIAISNAAKDGKEIPPIPKADLDWYKEKIKP